MFGTMRYKLFFMLKFSPVFYKLYRYSKAKVHGLATHDTDIVVEGYPRSANTFSYYLLLNIRPLKIAHHTHSVANIKLGIKYKIPTVILIRHPYDAIASVIFQKMGLKELDEKKLMFEIRKQLYYYHTFYSYVAKIHNNCLLVSFETIINNPETFIKETHNLILKKDRGLLISIGKEALDFKELANNVRVMIDRKEELKGLDERSWSSPKNRDKYNQKRNRIKQLIEKLDQGKAVSIYNKLIKYSY